MNDKELLELAAKAAGIELTWSNPYVSVGDFARVPNWNPLTDDGDALRLAVKLDMNLFSGYKKMIAEIDSDGDSPSIQSSEEKGDDHYAATRRAIVRAAAEIGKQS